MSDPIKLSAALNLLADILNKPHLKDDSTLLLRAGAEGRIPVYWRNSSQKFSSLLGFTKEVQERQQAVRLMRVSLHDLARLEIDESIKTEIFEPTDDDWAHLEAAKSEDGMRAITDANGTTVSRDQLLVFEEDLRRLASFPADQAEIPDHVRRLAALRELGGSAKRTHGDWRFKGIKALVAREESEGRKRRSEKIIRKDLKEAAQAEFDANRSGFATGLGQRSGSL